MWILNALLVLCILAIVMILIWGYAEWKSDPVEFFEPEKKVKYDVPIFTTKKAGHWW